MVIDLETARVAVMLFVVALVALPFLGMVLQRRNTFVQRETFPSGGGRKQNIPTGVKAYDLPPIQGADPNWDLAA
jgi:hypothetical protein